MKINTQKIITNNNQFQMVKNANNQSQNVKQPERAPTSLIKIESTNEEVTENADN